MSSYVRTIATLSGLLVLVGCAPTNTGSGTDAGSSSTVDGGNTSCTSSETRCTGTTFETCVNGAFQDTQTCQPNQLCSSSGCVSCVPESTYCVGNDVHQCTAIGEDGGTVETCSGGLQCGNGQCIDLCAEAEQSDSYIGCEYWAVDLDNAIEVMGPVDPLFGGCTPPPFGAGGNLLTGNQVCTDGNTTAGLCDPGGICPNVGFTCQTMDVCGFDAQHSAFAVVVSNPQSFPVIVTVANQAGMSRQATVAAGQVHKFYPQQLGFADQSIDGSGITSRAYKVTSEAPIVAYQFNPLDNEDVFSNDGSLLIPRSTFDAKYYALTWPTLNRRRATGGGLPGAATTNDYNGYVSIVAWKDNTQVRVTPAGNVRLGNGFAAIPAGSSQTFTLNAFDVLNLEADNTDAAPEQDLTGTLIEAVDGAATFGVFAGHEAIVIQNTNTSCCADHIEEMMFPSSTWGDSYAIARSADRGQNEPDLLRIMAQTDGTTVTITPTPNGSCPTLNAGQHCDIKINGDHLITSNNPILVGHFLLSVIDANTGVGDGDPAMALAVPVEQFRGTYTFLVPSEYDRQFVSVVAGSDVSVTLNGVDVTNQLSSFGGGAFKAGRITVQPGQQQINCPGGCGIEVYGYSEAVSYLFAGGLDLKQIVVD